MANNMKKLRCKMSIAIELIKTIGFNPFKNLYNKPLNVRECSYGNECIGAHDIDNVYKLNHIVKWEKVDISTFNFAELYYDIINVINKDKKLIKDKCDINFDNIEKLTFVELLHLWQKVACTYRKLANSLPKKNQIQINKPMPVSGYTYYEDVPQFNLSDKFEDYAWAIERMTHYCKQQNIFDNKLDTLQRMDKRKITPNELVTINEICIGSVNCKQGVHTLKEMLCVDDFYRGKCACLSPSDIVSQSEEIEEHMALVGNKKSPKYFILKERLDRLKNTIRKIHYSEQGMLPFNDQLEEYKIYLESEKIKLDEKNNSSKIQHDMIKNPDMKVGKVIKLKLKF